MTARHASVINAVQRHLEQLYRISVQQRATDFLITDAEVARQLDRSSNSREVEEKLLVSETDDGVDLALYVDEAVLDRLSEDDPVRDLHAGNVVDFCTALEGVSHFLYLTWNASINRAVRLLELELQAEVDKYISITTLAHEQCSRPSSQLHNWLFERATFDIALDDRERERYRDANHYAGKYCFELETRYLRGQPKETTDAMMGDIRHFYRLSLPEKIRRIDS